ncbi:TetR family transcriptional regulator [Rhizohabitans arisaemae]|uniref:TetR/AcrR family transcriptional regulator n=1 Tax=Rhizohabitans arisaemae TaxID=2720610 RepID=UPI0024B1DC5F|nr:TetR family transcriptional regulator [Rhizohabitans arisaemae]
MTAARRPGRRPGVSETRTEILAAARRMFAEKGFDGASIRGIAREAQVDPALVHHYFDSKESIFVEAMKLPLDPAVVIPFVAGGPREQAAERLVRTILSITATEEAREPMLALIRSAITNEQALAMVRPFLVQAVLARLAEALQIPLLRMELAFAQLFGALAARYVLRLEPLASADLDELAEQLIPAVAHHLRPEPPAAP